MIVCPTVRAQLLKSALVYLQIFMVCAHQNMFCIHNELWVSFLKIKYYLNLKLHKINELILWIIKVYIFDQADCLLIKENISRGLFDENFYVFVLKCKSQKKSLFVSNPHSRFEHMWKGCLQTSV